MQLNETKEEYQYINNSHDKIFRKILDNKDEAISIINRVLKNNCITSEEIEKYNSSYISNDLKNSEADVVYKMKNQDVFFLIEHQTKIDYSMSYRILKYEVEIIESVLIDNKYKNKEYKYSLIILIDVNNLEERELLEEKSLVSKMLLIEKSNTEKELEINLNKIIERKQIFNQVQIEFLILIIELVLQNQLIL